MKLDFSEIHRENEVLEGSLQEHLELISWNERKALTEKGVELDEIRMQLLEITKLQTLVNSRQPGDSSNVVSDIRNTRYSQDTTNVHLSKTTRARIRFEAKRDKFSSKNLFNVCRWNKSSAFDFGVSSNLMSSDLETKTDKENRLLCQGENQSNEKDREKKYIAQRTEASDNISKPFQCGVRTQSVHAESRHEGRAQTELPQPRPATVPRCRSRRQLEKVCRLVPERANITHLKVDWDVISRVSRGQKLQQLKVEYQGLQCRVHNFVSELDRLNQRSHVTMIPS